MMANLLSLALCLVSAISGSEGLWCWTCDNADSIEHCDRIGRLQECNPSQDVCGVEVRHSGGWQLAENVKVFKFCKQRQACANVQNQNDKRAWEIQQCNPKFPNSVCRCCCDSDECNFGELKCIGPIETSSTCFPPHVAPQNGGVVCTDGNKANSVCTFSCRERYYVVGESVSVCGSTQGHRWTTNAPTCQKITCPKIPQLENGHVQCTNDDSVCRFSCHLGYRLVGAESSYCEVDIEGSKIGKWSTNGQFCERKKCEDAMDTPDQGSMYCTEANLAGSVCHFSCDGNFEMAGPNSVRCMEADMYGKPYWDDLAPICKKKQCVSLPMEPENGFMVCSEEKFIHSVCQFRCDVEYYLYGESETVCTNSTSYAIKYGMPVWSNEEPSCERKLCSAISPAPGHEKISCTDDQFLGSVCTFKCDKMHFLVGNETTVCIQSEEFDLPYWENDVAECEPKRCGAAPEAPLNGNIVCDNEDILGSVCEFSCEGAFHRKGSEVTTCIEDYMDGTVYWDFPAPKCIKKECDSMPATPQNGDIECTDGNAFGSVCYFSCADDYDLVGYEQTACIEYHENKTVAWDGYSAECVLKECAYSPSVPDNGEMQCTNKQMYGSTCEFACGDEFVLIGAKIIKCGYPVDPNGSEKPKWNETSPICERKQCQSVAVPENGRVVCSDKNFIGSTCEYACDDHHSRVGPLYTACLEEEDGNLKWTTEAPVCERITCPELDNIRNGMIQCTNGQYVNSECKFSCTVDDYKLSPNTRYSITCQNDTMWSEKPPCCARSCPPFAVMDLVVVLDSSSSIGAPSWQIMLRFLQNIFDLFVVQNDAMNFGVIRYNKEIDTDHQINLNECPDNVEMLKDLVAEIPYNGKGTWTGQALSYVNENMLAPEAGNRESAPDVVLVITDGKSQDDVVEPAKALRERGALIFVLGITPLNGILDMEQLNAIAGSDNRLFLAEEGFAKLTPQFAEEISENICGDPCDRPIY